MAKPRTPGNAQLPIAPFYRRLSLPTRDRGFSSSAKDRDTTRHNRHTRHNSGTGRTSFTCYGYAHSKSWSPSRTRIVLFDGVGHPNSQNVHRRSIFPSKIYATVISEHKCHQSTCCFLGFPVGKWSPRNMGLLWLPSSPVSLSPSYCGSYTVLSAAHKQTNRPSKITNILHARW